MVIKKVLGMIIGFIIFPLILGVLLGAIGALIYFNILRTLVGILLIVAWCYSVKLARFQVMRCARWTLIGFVMLYIWTLLYLTAYFFNPFTLKELLYCLLSSVVIFYILFISMFLMEEFFWRETEEESDSTIKQPKLRWRIVSWLCGFFGESMNSLSARIARYIISFTLFIVWVCGIVFLLEFIYRTFAAYLESAIKYFWQPLVISVSIFISHALPLVILLASWGLWTMFILGIYDFIYPRYWFREEDKPEVLTKSWWEIIEQ